MEPFAASLSDNRKRRRKFLDSSLRRSRFGVHHIRDASNLKFVLRGFSRCLPFPSLSGSVSEAVTLSPKGCTMIQFANSIKRFIVSEDGPTAVEYAVMLALIIVVCLTAIQAVGTNAKTTFTSVSAQLGGS